MKKLLLLSFILIGSCAYAQKVIPIDKNLEDALVNHICLINFDMAKEAIDDIKNGKHPNVTTAELFVLRDLLDNRVINVQDMTHDLGIYEFNYSYKSPVWVHVFIKYKDDIIIIEDDFLDEHSLVKQTQFLLKFFNEHPDIPINFFSTFMKHIVDIYEWNRSHIDDADCMNPVDLQQMRDESRKLLP